MKKKKCKNKDCNNEFEARFPLQRACCRLCEFRIVEQKQKCKEEKTVKSKRTEVDVLTDTLVVVFHRYVRQRDKGKPCPSCGTPWRIDFQAGHYFSAGGHSAVRFDECNVNGQCPECNSSSNFSKDNYEKTIIKRWGATGLNYLILESNKTKRWEAEELKELINHYKNI